MLVRVINLNWFKPGTIPCLGRAHHTYIMVGYLGSRLSTFHPWLVFLTIQTLNNAVIMCKYCNLTIGPVVSPRDLISISSPREGSTPFSLALISTRG